MESVEHPVFGRIHSAMRFRGGIIIGNPARAVVFDAAGRLLVATRASGAFRIRCDRGAAVAYDALGGIVHVRREDCPENMGGSHGFFTRNPGPLERLMFKVQGIRAASMTPPIAVLSWTLA